MKTKTTLTIAEMRRQMAQRNKTLGKTKTPTKTPQNKEGQPAGLGTAGNELPAPAEAAAQSKRKYNFEFEAEASFMLRLPPEIAGKLRHVQQKMEEQMEALRQSIVFPRTCLLATVSDILTYAIVRWVVVTSRDVEQLKADAKETRDSLAKRVSLWRNGHAKRNAPKPLTVAVYRLPEIFWTRKNSLTRQFYEKGVPKAKFGVNHSLLMRQSIRRWEHVTGEDVAGFAEFLKQTSPRIIKLIAAQKQAAEKIARKLAAKEAKAAKRLST